MPSKKISVIVPVYNTEDELPRCLESIAGQTFGELEIICVDDGSTDCSGKIVDAFASADRRIKAVHKKNGGESSARNAGLRMATGEYIAFCDCDDWLERDMYEVLVRELETWNADLAAASWYMESDMGCQEIRNRMPVNDEVFGRNEFLGYLYKRDSYRGFAYMWDKLYKRELFYDSLGGMLLFDESLQLGGDVLFLAEIALRVKRVRYVDRAVYHYYQREDSGCHTKDVRKLRDWLRAYEMIIQRFEAERIDHEIVAYVKRFLAYHSSNAVETALDQGLEEAKKEFQEFMQKYEQEYVQLNMQYPGRIKRYRELAAK